MSRIISKNTLENIRARVDIAELIGSYIALKRAGSNFKALCPFHKEKTPSFHVNPHRQIFHCFGCGAGGDIFSFVMQHEGMIFTDAAAMLAERAGVVLDIDDGAADDGLDKNALYRLNADAAAFYHRTLLESPRAATARDYLNRRRLNSETIENFQIGYAPLGWDAVLNGARKKGYTVEQIELVGLVLKSEKPGRPDRYYDRFRDRIMFPICDEQGRVIGFSGRTLIKDEKAAKYVNSPETPLFKKSRVLFALHRARRAILESREALVCEGQIDVIRCHQEGLTAAVASQGTAFTEDHARILQRYADSICLAFDPDKAGQEAAIRATRVFFQAGLAVRVAALPAGEDADSFIREQGLPAFRQCIDSAQSALSFQATILSGSEDLGSEAGLMRGAASILETVACSPDAVHREKLLQEVSGLLNIRGVILEDLLRKIASRQRRGDRAEDGAAPATEQAIVRPRDEVELCEHAVHAADRPEIVALIEQRLPWDAVSDSVCKSVLEAVVSAAREQRPVQETLFARSDASGEFQRFFSGLLARPPKVVGPESSHLDAVRDLILRLWRNKLKRERQALSGANVAERQAQITYDLYHLKTWADGKDIIEFELARRNETNTER